MFKAFLNDKSSFKNFVIMMLMISLLLFIVSYIAFGKFVAKVNENARLDATYHAQLDWLNRFDIGEALRLQKSILRPCSEAEVEQVQQRQMEMIRETVNLISVKKQTGSEIRKGSKLKCLKTSVVADGSWEDIKKLLNGFEKENLVVITRLNLAKDDTVKARFDYAIYYQ